MAKEGKVEEKRDVGGQRSEVRAVVGCPAEESLRRGYLRLGSTRVKWAAPKSHVSPSSVSHLRMS